MSSILVIDDDQNVRKTLKGLLQNAGFEVFAAGDVDSGMSLLAREGCELVITDLKMPGKSGMELLDLIHDRDPAVPAIMITGYASIEDAVTAMKKGAYDFISKPFDEEELLAVARKALSELEKNRNLVSTYFDRGSSLSPGVIGNTSAMEQVFRTVRKVASTDSTVLITGETGVGKELIAKAIHLASQRRSHPLVKVNCAAIPENLLESELFGYERGAFTGAVISKPGRFELADRGTLFLDEIGEIPFHLQAKLLTVLQDRAFERVGGVKTIKVDLRIVAATNKDLQSAVRSGSFRSDLFYRLNVVPILVPPLRERKDDLAALVDYFLGRFSRKHERPLCRVSQEVLAAFVDYNWPGNIRELENVLERMILLSESEVLGPDVVPDEMKGPGTKDESATMRQKMEAISQATEKQMIINALNRTDQNRTKAAALLGISRRTLQSKIKEYGL